ncbi:MAG: tetratricopeptide repeat protein [Candidatus Eremiobacterota bacterium]
MLTDAGRHQDALPDAEEAARLAPEEPGVRDTLGLVYLGLGRTEAALKELERASQGSPDPGLRAHLGLALARSGQTKRARRAFLEALDGYRKDPPISEHDRAMETRARKFVADNP